MYGPGAVGRGEWYVYDTEIGFPGLIIDGTECSSTGVEPLPLSESYEHMVAEVSGMPDAIEDFDRRTRLRCFKATQWANVVRPHCQGILSYGQVNT